MAPSSQQETFLWDAFLEGTPLGQFQQSSGWAYVKSVEGWNTVRVFNQDGQNFHGGWQLLWKATRFGRIGYISKGPVLLEESPASISACLRSVADAARRLRLIAIILQPPDASCITSEDLCRHGYSWLPLPSIVDTTLITDVTGPFEALEKRMNRRVLQKTRQAVKCGVTVHEGRKHDMAVFFELMCATCKRQQTKPNPARVESLHALWDAFYPRVRLVFARVDGKTVAGLLMIGFGNRLTFWKKGWNNEAKDAHPNAYLNVESLRWANANGYREVDFTNGDRGIALASQEGKSLTKAQQNSRHLFNMRLGAQPRFLPPARFFIVNPGLRVLFNTSIRLPLVRKVFFSLIDRLG